MVRRLLSKFQHWRLPIGRTTLAAVSIRPSAARPTISTSQPSAPSTATPNDPSSPLGNLGRNVATTNEIYDFDFGLHKEFPLKREGMRIEFRSEFFNLFNKSNLGAASANVLAGNFGAITSPGAAGAADSVCVEVRVLVRTSADPIAAGGQRG